MLFHDAAFAIAGMSINLCLQNNEQLLAALKHAFVGTGAVCCNAGQEGLSCVQQGHHASQLMCWQIQNSPYGPVYRLNRLEQTAGVITYCMD